MEVVYPAAYADLVRFKVQWETSYGKGGPNAHLDFDFRGFDPGPLSGFTDPQPSTDTTAQ